MKYNKVQRHRGKNAIWAVYEDNMNTFDYILTEDEIGLDNIMNKLKYYIRNEFPMKFSAEFILPNGKEVFEYSENATVFAFDYSDFKGKAKILNNVRFFLFISNDKHPIKFFVNERGGEDFAYYFQSYSNINPNNQEDNFGSIFINFRYFIQEWKNTNNVNKLFNQLEEIIFHELRHYYDNILGVYKDNTDDYKIIDLELWCEQCLRKADDIENLPLLRSLTYIMDETELNAFTQSFYVLIKKYILANKGNISKQNIIDNIYSNQEDFYPYFIYSLNEIFKSTAEFIDYIKKSSDNIIDIYYYLYLETKNIFTFTKDDKKKFNDVFNQNYLDTTKADMKTIRKELPYAFIKFMDNEYIPFIFKIFIKNYKRTFMNMNNIIDFLLNKYNK